MKSPKQKIIDAANKMIAEAATPEKRTELKEVFTSLLMAAGYYNGYNYVDWLGGGFERWKADGKPYDNTPYLGDMTKVRFHY